MRALLLALALVGCTAAQIDPPARATTAPTTVELAEPRAAVAEESLRCSERLALPPIADVVDARWSPDSRSLAIVRFHLVPSRFTITGHEEQRILSIVDVATGTVRDLNVATYPEWSASGGLLSYWRDENRSKEDEFLRVVRDGRTVGLVESTQPEARWVGEELLHWYVNEIRAWKDGQVRTVATVSLPAPIYPAEDTAFSADGTQFTVTRHLLSGAVQRYLGVTRTGEVTAITDPDVAHTEWSPRGATLLLRSRDRVTLRAADGTQRTAALDPKARVHGWTADGRLILGTVSPTVPGGDALDQFTVFGAKSLASLPNLAGARAFSPDGTLFAGVSRTGVASNQLELFRCGPAAGTETRAAAAARGTQRMREDGLRSLRPVVGAITQYRQGRHTGVDIGAPLGSIVYAADDGVVSATERHPVGGYRVCVTQADGLESCAYHTAHALVDVGETVARGQPIALVGLTGITTGSHLHWEVRQNGEVVDPLGR
ncbi:MAG TPA: M23 family metallopeptidase [Candidatus Limnocylindria bacterium]|nr:M23 family metallopeptidase [Candidatus Limnocylindria bacterium]